MRRPPRPRGDDNRYAWNPPGLRWTNPLEVISVGIPQRTPEQPGVPGALHVVVEVVDLGGRFAPISPDATRNELVKLALVATPKAAALVIASLLIDGQRGGYGPELGERVTQAVARMSSGPPPAWERYGQPWPAERPQGGGF